MRHRRAFFVVSFALMAVGGACTSFGSDTEPVVGDASASDGATTATATVPTTPPGGQDSGRVLPGVDSGALSPGWGAAFVSAATTTGNLGQGQVQADTICTNEGQRIKAGAKFKALLFLKDSDTLFSRAQSSGPRYMPNGDGSQGRLAITNVGAVGGAFLVRGHADGGEVGRDRRVWTGAPNDAGSSLHCGTGDGPWTSENGGLTGATGSPWAEAGVEGYALASCNQTESLFCVEVGDFR
ncbi:MAG: hypothetical protein JNM74_17500 [Myxococcales bacterium]|nr:hypothetical protein [Myxococcales bacterium]